MNTPQTTLLLEEESVIKTSVEDVDLIKKIEIYMQEEPYYGEPDFIIY